MIRINSCFAISKKIIRGTHLSRDAFVYGHKYPGMQLSRMQMSRYTIIWDANVRPPERGGGIKTRNKFSPFFSETQRTSHQFSMSSNVDNLKCTKVFICKQSQKQRWLKKNKIYLNKPKERQKRKKKRQKNSLVYKQMFLWTLKVGTPACLKKNNVFIKQLLYLIAYKTASI